MTINIITKNLGKLLAAKAIFSKFEIEVNQITKEFPEIQADTSLEIAKYTAIQAARELKLPMIREDHSLFINALGIPGPYTNYIEKKISTEKLLKILSNFNDRSGFFEIGTIYAKPDGTTQEYSYQVPIQFAKEERGNLQTGWNRIIMLEAETRTLAEYPEIERVGIWGKNYESIAKFIKEEKAKSNI